ncbi:MAG: MFS transporter [Acidobacteriota bacterium]|nr:MFS transporter [Acidobacteriota bacterium]
MDSAAEETVQPPRGYLELLRENPNFRRLWLGQVVSQLGDWFNTIALYAIALKLTDSEQAVALILVTRFLSTVFSSPLAGVIADRFNRKKVMIATDLARAVVVLGFLFIRGPEDVWLIYFLTILQLVLSTLFEPARSASIPAVVEPKDLLTANGITAVTWSAMLTLGAAVGGFATAALGTDAAFVLDSATYLLSAVLFLGLNLPQRPPREKQKLTVFRATGLEDVYEGLKYVWGKPRVLTVMLAKPAQCIAGGTLTLLAIYGEKVFPVAGSGEIGIGVLYAVRGIGTAMTPVFVQRFVRGSRRSLENSLGAAFFIIGTFFALFGATENYPLAIGLLLIAYVGGSLIWMNSTALMQQYVDDDFRGRVFAAELCLLTLVLAGSNYAVGVLLDDFNFSLRQVTIGIGLTATIPGIIWFATRKFWQRDD